jgi:hypothetical protein
MGGRSDRGTRCRIQDARCRIRKRSGATPETEFLKIQNRKIRGCRGFPSTLAFCYSEKLGGPYALGERLSTS